MSSTYKARAGTSTKQGYAILTYDRIGNGHSSKPDAYKVAQAPAEVEVLRELTRPAGGGTLFEASAGNSSNHPHARQDGNIGAPRAQYKPSKIVHVGHSFGSIVTSGMLSLYGEMSKGALLTGFILRSQLSTTKFSESGLEYAPQHDKRRFGDRSSSYLVRATQTNIAQGFLKKGAYDPKLLRYAESIKQTATIGEMVSGGALFGHLATNFAALVQFFLDEYDVLVCAGDCKNKYSVDTMKLLCLAATDIDVTLQPGTGHGLTLSTNSTAGYQVMFSYLEDHGL